VRSPSASLRKGFVLLGVGKRRSELERWFHDDLIPRFQYRILPITDRIADRWGVLDGESQLKGNPLNMADGMIAATALEHDLTLVTRNVKDFARLGVRLFNPWDHPLSPAVAGRTHREFFQKVSSWRTMLG
jgi:toxin FitB